MRPAPTSIYTLSLHDALPISQQRRRVTERFLRGLRVRVEINQGALVGGLDFNHWGRDRKSTRLNSSHVAISYAVFCLKKKNEEKRKRQGRHTDIKIALVSEAG